jgi:hypothetical protein
VIYSLGMTPGKKKWKQTSRKGFRKYYCTAGNETVICERKMWGRP